MYNIYLLFLCITSFFFFFFCYCFQLYLYIVPFCLILLKYIPQFVVFMVDFSFSKKKNIIIIICPLKKKKKTIRKNQQPKNSKYRWLGSDTKPLKNGFFSSSSPQFPFHHCSSLSPKTLPYPFPDLSQTLQQTPFL